MVAPCVRWSQAPPASGSSFQELRTCFFLKNDAFDQNLAPFSHSCLASACLPRNVRRSVMKSWNTHHQILSDVPTTGSLLGDSTDYEHRTELGVSIFKEQLSQRIKMQSSILTVMAFAMPSAAWSFVPPNRNAAQKPMALSMAEGDEDEPVLNKYSR